MSPQGSPTTVARSTSNAWGRRSLRLSAAVVTATLAVVDLSGAAHAAGARTSDARRVVNDVNFERSKGHVRVIGINLQANAKALKWAQHVAWTGIVEHSAGGGAMSPNGYTGSCWTSLGENVGRGSSLAAIHAAFMRSPRHRANILSGRWTSMGAGVVFDGHTYTIVQEFFRAC
jgi:uncharacterized protein YkwD